MTPTLPEIRAAVAAAVDAEGLTVYDYHPDRMVAPCVTVFPGDPWITADQGSGPSNLGYWANWTVTVYVNEAPLKDQTGRLEHHLAGVLAAWTADPSFGLETRFILDGVKQPERIAVNEAMLLAADVQFSCPTFI